MPANPAAGIPQSSGAPALTWWERLKYAMVRPDDAPPEVKPDERSAGELEATIRRADDRERAVGLIAAPVAALIGFLVIGANISRNSSATTLPKNFVPASTYHWVLLVFLALAVVMLVGAWLRKRIVLAVALALYGVGLFQLGWLGFAVPFVLAGAWYLVRGFRLQTALKRAEGDAGGPPVLASRAANGVRPRPNKRYTPPT
jgi:hypothetical protein